MKNANLVTKKTAELLKRLASVIPIKFTATDFDTIERGGNLWVRLKPQTITSQSSGGSSIFPFQISATATAITAAAGTLEGYSIAAITQNAPANGDWYLQAKIIINATTGNVTSRAVEWVQTTGTPSATNYYSTIGKITVTATVPDAATIEQYNYGPLLTLRYGGVTDKWTLIIF